MLQCAGTLYLAGAAGVIHTRDPLLGTRLGPALFGGVGLGLLGSAAFSTDSVSSYPPGTLYAPTEQTTTMTIHGIAAARSQPEPTRPPLVWRAFTIRSDLDLRSRP